MAVNVNYLPVPTWNRLGVNKASADTSAFDKCRMDAIYTEKNTDSISCTVADSASAITDSFAGEIIREKFIAGKRAVYAEQNLQTGLGREFEDFVKENTQKVKVFTVDEGQMVQEPVILNWDFRNGSKEICEQIIHAKKNSVSTFLMIYSSCPERNASGAAAFMTKVIIEDGARVNLLKINLLGTAFTLFDDTGAIAFKDASFNFTQMEIGGAQVYAGAYTDLRGDKSSLSIDCGYMAKDDHKIDINYVACQRGAKTQSEIRVKGSLKDKASKIFRGTIDFRNGAKAAVGDEREDVLLLSDDAVNKTVPVILTEEEDVDGHHGATIGNLSPEILYYLGTRGIDKNAARMLMTRGRLMEIAHKIPDKATIERISAFIEEAFKSE